MLTEVAKRDSEVWIAGAWVRAAAEAAGEKSQQDLADLAKAHRTTPYRWMRLDTKGGVDYITWRGILAVLGLPGDWQPAAGWTPKVRKSKKLLPLAPPDPPTPQ